MRISNEINKQIIARKIYKEYSCKTKLWRKIENRFGVPLEDLLYKLLIIKKSNGIQMAKKLGIHSSTIYRWLEKTNVRSPSKRGSREWQKRVHWKEYLEK